MAFPLKFPRALSSQSSGQGLRTRLLAASAVCVLSVLPLSAQQPTYSSSSNHALLAGEDIDGATPGASPTPTASAALPQYGGGNGGYSGYHESKLSHLAFEVGGGFTAPIGNDVSGGFTTAIGNGTNYGTDTWGGNLLAGAGWAFSKRLTLLGEYQFNTNKIPGRTLSAVYNGDPVDYANAGIASIGGNVRTNSITAEPVFYYYNSDKHKYAGYVIGGVGWYHKTINFTAPVEEESFYGVYVVNETFSSYSDNALGFNLGTGVSFKPFGQDSKAKLFAEARYTFANTPTETSAEVTSGQNVLHTGTEGLIPVSVGLRF